MRRAVLTLLCCLVACQEPNTRVDAVTVHWMDWPAEVNAGQPFRTRLIVGAVCAQNPRFGAGTHADISAVTFEPYFTVDPQPIECVAGVPSVLLVGGGLLDTAAIAPALSATSARTYEMRASLPVYATAVSAANLPVGTFGTVVVRPNGADGSRRNAAGYAGFWRDTSGCVRLRPVGLYDPSAFLVLEDQADTSSGSNAFVRGYVHDAATPVCGETRVFHLESRH